MRDKRDGLRDLAAKVAAMPRGAARARARARLRGLGWRPEKCPCGAQALVGVPQCGICYRHAQDNGEDR